MRPSPAIRVLARSAVISCVASALAFPAFGQDAGKALARPEPRGALAPPAAGRAKPAPSPNPRPLSHPKRYGLALGQKRVWLFLALAQHGAAFFDARTTRDTMGHDAVRQYGELDPLLRPFAHSAALYPVMQIGPAGLDWLALRLSGSHRRWLRRIWWLPQTAAVAGFVWSGAHNLRLPERAAR
jgi:hypothetical protein